MRWCLAEAKRNMERDFVKRAVHIMLAQDARNGKVLARVSVANDKFENQRFTLATVDLDGTNSFAIRDATSKAIQRWATPLFKIPRWGNTAMVHREAAKVDEVARECLCNAVSGIATDAASDEFRAVRLATGQSKSVFVEDALLPNVILHGKDPTHASGRFLKVWNADPYIKAVFDSFVWAGDSMCSMIENSPDISRRFALRVQALEGSDIDGNKIKNMKFVRPRFNSSQAPLARCVLFFDALVGLAVEVSAVRSGDPPARTSQKFLADLDEDRRSIHFTYKTICCAGPLA
jgi:hypothetical protein